MDGSSVASSELLLDPHAASGHGGGGGAAASQAVAASHVELGGGGGAGAAALAEEAPAVPGLPGRRAEPGAASEHAEGALHEHGGGAASAGEPASLSYYQSARARALSGLRREWQSLQRRRWAYDLQVLKRFPMLVALATWHTYGIWLAATALVCLAGNSLLSWYIDWYQRVPPPKDLTSQNFPYVPFFAIFLRSWMFVHLTGELFRFCFVLVREVWRLDPFSSYRRILCGLEVPEACADTHARDGFGNHIQWPEDAHTSWHWWVDQAVQTIIYLSFDVVPFVLGAIKAFAGQQRDLGGGMVVLFEALMGVSLLHVTVYFLAWSATDLYLKVRGFRAAWREDALRWRRRLWQVRRTRRISRRSMSSPPPSFTSAEAGQLGESPRQNTPGGWLGCLGRFCADCRNKLEGCWQRFSRPCCLLRRWISGTHSDRDEHSDDEGEEEEDCVPNGAGGPRGLGLHHNVADRMNICVCFCGWLGVIQYYALFAAVVVGCVVAAAKARKAIWWVLCFVGMVLLIIWKCRWSSEMPLPEPCRLQEWGETACGMDPKLRSSTHRAFGVVLLLQGALFVVAKQWAGVGICAGLFAALVVREVTLHYEGNHGWWIGLLEAVVIWVTVIIVNFVALPGGQMGVLTLVLAVLHQFGLRRFNPRGMRLVEVVRGLMYFILVLVVGAVLLSAAPSEATTWSAFKAGGKNYTFAPKDVRGLGMACETRFASGKVGQSFSLGDFGLFSSLAYESTKTMPAALQHFFPGWKIVYSRVAQGGTSVPAEEKSDWTTFFEYSDPSDTTSVIAIRGTDTTLDILNDINIWMSAALMQGFELIGPWMSVGITQAVSFWSSFVVGGSTEHYFSKLLTYAQGRKMNETNRRFYITGHSLGGGLAKLVASKIDVEAVTFMAPGLERTGFIVFRWATVPDVLRRLTLTVRPHGDIVSRVDTQVGAVIPTECDKDPLSCHALYEAALCPLFQQCGSMRAGPGAKLSLPCGQCAALKC